MPEPGTAALAKTKTRITASARAAMKAVPENSKKTITLNQAKKDTKS